MAVQFHIFDVDGTIADDSHRRHLLPSTKKGNQSDWDHYHAAHTADELLEQNARVVRECLAAGHQVIFLTGRPEAHRESTTHQLQRWFETGNFWLAMRRDRDLRPAPTIKRECVEREVVPLAPKEIHFYDDRPDNLKAVGLIGGINLYRADRQRGMVPVRILEGELVPVERGAADILVQMAETFRQRNAVYKDNYLKVPAIMKVMFPDGIPAEVLHHPTWHLFELIIVKLARFGNANLTHTESIHDVGVYAAMIESIIEGDQRNA